MEKLPHHELERLSLTTKEPLGRGCAELRAELTPARLNSRSTIAQISYRAAQVRLLAEGGRP
jgi:hypothetical protein